MLTITDLIIMIMPWIHSGEVKKLSVLFGKPYHGEITSLVANDVIKLLSESRLTAKEIETVMEIVTCQLDYAMREVKPELELFLLQK